MLAGIWEFYKEYAFIAFVLFMVGFSVHKLIQEQNTKWVKPLFVALSISILIMVAVVLLVIRK